MPLRPASRFAQKARTSAAPGNRPDIPTMAMALSMPSFPSSAGSARRAPTLHGLLLTLGAVLGAVGRGTGGRQTGSRQTGSRQTVDRQTVDHPGQALDRRVLEQVDQPELF